MNFGTHRLLRLPASPRLGRPLRSVFAFVDPTPLVSWPRTGAARGRVGYVGYASILSYKLCVFVHQTGYPIFKAKTYWFFH